MLTTSQKYFITLLKDYIHGLDSEETEINTSWDDLFSIAMSHSLEGIIYYQSSGILPEGIKRNYLKPYLAHIAHLSLRKEILQELINRLSYESIPIICFKGTVLCDYYPLSPLRSMGDMDIVVKVQDRETVDKILRNDMSFERFIYNHAVWTYWKGNIYIEVHTHMFYEHLANQIDYRTYFDDVWNHIHNAAVLGIESDYLYVPDESFHFLYLITHHAKHIINNGSGFRAYLDLVFMCNACEKKLDWIWIQDELNRLKLYQFTLTCFRLCELWFHVKMPLKTQKLNQSFFERITEKTFQDGVFGLGNKMNASAHVAKEIKREKVKGHSYVYGSIKYIMIKIFPPYEDMQLIPWYSFVDGRPWLMPIAWVYRWIYCLIKKRSHSIALFKEPIAQKDIVDKREDLIKLWGL